MDFPDQSDIYSAYPHLAGQEVNWLDTDSAEQYSANYNDTNKRKLLEKLRWTKHNITYTFNSNGFRAPEFKKNEPNIVFLGCSFTVGIGLNISDTFSHNVSQSLGLQNYNLGKGGGSNKTAFRVGHHWIPKLKPKIVVLMSPEITRSEIIMGGKAINLSFTDGRDRKLKFRFFSKHTSIRENKHRCWCSFYSATKEKRYARSKGKRR